MKTTTELINDIQSQLEREQELPKPRSIFRSYIEYVRFPLFKHFENDLKINFDFPITFLIGQNGSGKSSVLHALYGSVKGKNVSDFWFSTTVDPIQSLPDKPHCFICGFLAHKSRLQAEVIKTRRSRTGNPDYWETAKPIVGYGMQADIPAAAHSDEVSKSRDRWTPINKKVKYLDFRYELSAFDKYFYFGDEPNTITMNSKQDYLRRYATPLSRAIKSTRKYFYRNRSGVSTKLSQEELNVLSYILGKNYKSAILVEHDFYKTGEKNFSVFYTTDHAEYSEAFSGSGETAVIRLVKDIFDADKYSLILLDEPETSLHPGAQKKLIQFILDQVIKKQLQVVISTHSSHIIEDMPREAIKVFAQNSSTGKSNVIGNVLPEEAFYYIGNAVSFKRLIIVEDALAQMLVEYVLSKMDGHTSSLFEVRFYSGGKDYLKQHLVPVLCKEESQAFVLFDGDQKPAGHFDISGLRDLDKNVDFLNEKIKAQTGSEVQFFPDGGSDGGRKDQEVELMIEYLDYYKTNVYYLPQETPEQIIWDERMLNKIDSATAQQVIREEENYKNKFKLYAKEMFGDDKAENIKAVHTMFVHKFQEHYPELFREVKTILEDIRDGNPFIFD